MTLALVLGLFGFLIATVIAPYAGAVADRHRQRRRELDRCGRVAFPTAPRFTRDDRRDPSPKPRKAR